MSFFFGGGVANDRLAAPFCMRARVQDVCARRSVDLFASERECGFACAHACAYTRLCVGVLMRVCMQVEEEIQQWQSDAVLCCPYCFTTVCYDSIRHETENHRSDTRVHLCACVQLAVRPAGVLWCMHKCARAYASHASVVSSRVNTHELDTRAPTCVCNCRP